MKPPIVVYFGHYFQGSTSAQRAKALEVHGWKVHPFNAATYQRNGSRIRRSAQHHLLVGPDVHRLNQDFEHFVKSIKPTIIWIDKGRWITASTLSKITSSIQPVLVHYTPDPAFTVHSSRHFQRGIPAYDLLVTTKEYELKLYEKYGARSVSLAPQGADPQIASAADSTSWSDRQGMLFVGHWERHYEISLTRLAQDYPNQLSIFGPGWEDKRKKSGALSNCIKGNGLFGTEYFKALAKAKIGLGLLSKRCPDTFTTRTFEIPMGGAALLAEQTEAHQQFFRDGVEVMLFSNPDEMSNKAQYLLTNEDGAAIASAGHQRARNSYTWEASLREPIQQIEALLTNEPTRAQSGGAR